MGSGILLARPPSPRPGRFEFSSFTRATHPADPGRVSKDRLAPLDQEHPENRGVLAHLRRGTGADCVPIARPSAVTDPYLTCGCHPDVVERVWDQLGAELPRASRALVHGVPALVHARSGVVLVLGLGTSYALRLPAEDLHDPAASALARVHTYRTVRETLDLASWGASWRFGAYHAREPAWVLRAAAELAG